MKDKILQGGSLALYATGIVLWVLKKNPFLFAGILALHIAEYFMIAGKIGQKAGISKGKSFLLCLLFGFTWWLPLKKRQD